MRSLRTRILALALALAASAASAAGANATAPGESDSPVVRIGLSAPISLAEMHGIGTEVRDGAQMAIDDLNARGVRLGARAVRLELVVVDDHAEPFQDAVLATVRAMTQAHVAGVVGPMNSGVALRTAGLYAQAGVPMISPSATHPGLTRMGLASVFRLQPDDAALAQRLVAWAARERHLRRVSIVTDASGYGQVMSTVFRLATQQAGLKVDDEVKLAPGQTDFAAVVSRLGMAHSDAVLVAGLDGAGAALYRAWHEHGGTAPLIGGDGFCSLAFARLALPVSRGDVLCARQGQHATEPPAALTAFGQRFAQRFDHAPDAEDDDAPYAYDAVRVLVAAMVDAGSSDPAVYLPHLRATTLADSLVGPFHFDAQGDVPDGTIALFTYDGTQRVYLQPLP